MSSLVIPLSELESARLTLLGGEPWARALFGRLLATPQPVVPYADVVSGSGYIPQHPADTSAATSTQQEILANTTYLRTLFAGTPKVIGNSGEIAYMNILQTAFPKINFVRVASEGQSGDIRADFSDDSSVLMEVKTRASNVPGVEIAHFHANMRARRQHGIMLNARGGIVYRPHRFNVDIIPADDRQLVAIYIPNNGGDMDTVGLAFNLIRKISPALDALQGKELIFSLELCEEVSKIVGVKCRALRAAQASNRSIAALVDKQARELEASTLDDISAVFSNACAKVKTMTPAQLPLRLTAADIA